MSQVWAIVRKELKGYFDSPLAYIFLTVFLLASSWLFMRGFFLVNNVSMRGFFGVMPWIFLFLIPAITMRLWAEEKKTGTLEVMLTSPLTDWQMVMGKFLASFLFLAIAIGLTLNLPIVMALAGNPDGGLIFSGYVGTLLMGGAYLAIGLWASSLTKNQIVAFILSVVVTFALLMIGETFFLYSVPSFLAPAFRYLGLTTHFSGIMRGVIDSQDLLYYLLLIAFFLYLNARNLIRRR